MPNEVPGKLQVIIVVQLVTGMLITVFWGGAIVGTNGAALLLVVPLYGLVEGVTAIISGAKGLTIAPKHHLYRRTAILQTIGLIAGDIPGFLSGILALILLSKQEVQDFLRGED